MAGVVPSASNFTTSNVMLGGSQNNVYNHSTQHHATVNRGSAAPHSQFVNSSNFNQQFGNSNGTGNMIVSQIAQHKFCPSLRLKSNEFFYKWISDKERGDQLNEIIAFIKAHNRIPKTNELQTFKVCLINFIKSSFLSRLINYNSLGHFKWAEQFI